MTHNFRHILPLFLLLTAAGAPAAETATTPAWRWWPLQTDVTSPSCREGQDSLTYSVSLEGLASSGKYAPFWLQSNQNGRIAASPFSGYLSAGIQKEASSPSRWFDYDFAAEVTASAYSTMPAGAAFQDEYIGGTREGILTGCDLTRKSGIPQWCGKNAAFRIDRLYAHTRLFIFDITAGIKPFESSLPEAGLSTGGLLFSGNALPMPGISIGIDHYTPFPGLFGYVEVKGHVEHDWITDNCFVQGAFLHYKYAGARFGGKLPVNISYEMQHVAQWGGYSPIYGDLGNNMSGFLNALLARAGGNNINDQNNVQGNHLIVQQLQLDVKMDDWKASVYWQTLSEDNSFAFIGCGSAIRDGLWGVSFRQQKWPFISGICFEYLGTTDQTGPFHDQDGLIYAGNDAYYRNAIYEQGWSYFGRTIGTPFITSPFYNTDGLIDTENNRTKVLHAALDGDIYGFKYRAKLSFARNWGTYVNEEIYHIHTTNTAWLLEVNRHVDKAWGLDFGVRLAGDMGSQFGNTFGAMITVRKSGLITRW